MHMYASEWLVVEVSTICTTLVALRGKPSFRDVILEAGASKALHQPGAGAYAGFWKGGLHPGGPGCLQRGQGGSAPCGMDGQSPRRKFLKTKLPESHIICQNSILHWFTRLYKCIAK